MPLTSGHAHVQWPTGSLASQTLLVLMVFGWMEQLGSGTMLSCIEIWKLDTANQIVLYNYDIAGGNQRGIHTGGGGTWDFPPPKLQFPPPPKINLALIINYALQKQ